MDSNEDLWWWKYDHDNPKLTGNWLLSQLVHHVTSLRTGARISSTFRLHFAWFPFAFFRLRSNQTKPHLYSYLASSRAFCGSSRRTQHPQHILSWRAHEKSHTLASVLSLHMHPVSGRGETMIRVKIDNRGRRDSPQHEWGLPQLASSEIISQVGMSLDWFFGGDHW